MLASSTCKTIVKRLLFLIGLWAVTIALLGHRQPLRSQALIDSVLAVVEGHVIMSSDVRAFLALGLVESPRKSEPIRSEMLTMLIRRRLMLDEVDRFTLDDPPADEVAERMKGLIERLGGQSSLSQMLAAVGYTEGDLEQVLRDDLRISTYLSGRFPLATESTTEEAAVRLDLIDAWIASLVSRADVTRLRIY